MMFDLETVGILGLLSGIIATITLYAVILPKKRDGTFSNGFWQWVHNFFHFKKIYLEGILRFVFTLATILCICFGFFMLFGYEETVSYSYYYGYYDTDKESMFLPGLALIFIAPIMLRLMFEGIMMFILLVKNTMEINNKLPDIKNDKATDHVEPAPRPAEIPGWVCACGNANAADARFCRTCGSARNNPAPSPVVSADPADETVSNAPKTAWYCHTCGSLNSAAAISCGNCGLPRR